MRNIVTVLLLSILIFAFSCEPAHKAPEPHLELGQKISFPGANDEKSYIILGYRDEADGETSRFYHDQAYIVFIYVNDQEDVKQGIIHKNAVLKN